MTSGIRNTLLLVALAFALVLAWSSATRNILEPDVVHDPEQRGWQLTFQPYGQTTVFAVDFNVLAKKSDGERSESIDPSSYVDVAGAGNLTCHDGGSSSASVVAQCRYTFKQSQTISTVTVMPNKDVEFNRKNISIAEPTTRILQQTRHTPFPPEKLVILLGILLLVSPIVWITHSNKALSQWVIVGIAIGVLVWLQPVFSAGLLGIILVYYWLGLSYARSANRRALIILWWIVCTIFILLLYKNFKALFLVRFEDLGIYAFILPLGTSYFLIRLIDLQLRWHRGQLVDLTLREYLCYLLFPPTLTAGPIELVDTFYKNRPEKLSIQFVGEGAMRVALGLFKKLVIVDVLVSQALFGSGIWQNVISDPSSAGADVIWFCALAYLFAYLDFSAYSDIAIGLGRMFGYRIRENFNWPILASSLSVFWQRWHMSLSGWCFRNIYFPMLLATKRQNVSLIVTLFSVGVWHSLSFSWLTWGLYHGTGLAVFGYFAKNRLTSIDYTKGWGFVVGLIATNIFVVAGFSFVSIHDYQVAISVFLAFWENLIAAPAQALLSLINPVNG